ncbi:hypothetical protein ES703_71653 [subsurface metagenome]
MQENEQKSPVNRFEIACEIVFLAAATIALYLFGATWVFHHDWGFPWRIIPAKLSALTVLGLDVAWIIAVKKCSRIKNIHIKIILTLLVLTLSAIILTDMYFIYLFNNVW